MGGEGSGGRGRHLHDGQPDCSLQECRRMAGHLDEERRTVLLLHSTIIISKYFVDFIFPLFSTLHYILWHCIVDCCLGISRAAD